MFPSYVMRSYYDKLSTDGTDSRGTQPAAFRYPPPAVPLFPAATIH